jgi:potassium-transporting ATPase KdpC subunit
MVSQLKSAILITIVLTVLTGLAYPLAITGLCQVLFHTQANGSLVARDGTVVGSELIAQNFTKPEYFHPRPSAAGPNGFDPTASGGSALGPTNPVLAERLKKDAAAYRAQNRTNEPIPADAITTSGSGLDPEISPANALIQVARVAHARNVPADQIAALVRLNTDGRQLGFLGDPRVNVLKLNLALDQRYPVHKQLKRLNNAETGTPDCDGRVGVRPCAGRPGFAREATDG